MKKAATKAVGRRMHRVSEGSPIHECSRAIVGGTSGKPKYHAHAHSIDPNANHKAEKGFQITHFGPSAERKLPQKKKQHASVEAIGGGRRHHFKQKKADQA